MAGILLPCEAVTVPAAWVDGRRERRCGAETTLVGKDGETPRCKAHGGGPRFVLEMLPGCPECRQGSCCNLCDDCPRCNVEVKPDGS